jgi:hypothetical protein
LEQSAEPPQSTLSPVRYFTGLADATYLTVLSMTNGEKARCDDSRAKTKQAKRIDTGGLTKARQADNLKIKNFDYHASRNFNLDVLSRGSRANRLPATFRLGYIGILSTSTLAPKFKRAHKQQI